jgi:hypothetical protein
MKNTSKYISFICFFSLLFLTSCEDTDNEANVVVERFDITKIEVKSTGSADQSQPEIIRFVSDTKGVVVNSMQKTLDFFTISGTGITMTNEQVQLTDSEDADASSVDVSVDETIIAAVVTKGACARGELYLVDVATNTKNGPYELGYNPDAVDISADNKYVVVVNEFDYDDAIDGSCDAVNYPGVTIYDISAGLGNAVLVKDMKITHRGTNNDLAEPEGVKIAPDGETVFMTLQESNEIGWFSLSNPSMIPDTLQYRATLVDGHKADGIYVSDDQSFICTAGEIGGQIGIIMLDGENGTPGTQYYANLSEDLPATWDWNDEPKGIEPEEITVVEKDGKVFVLTTLQDPSAVVVYNITNPANPVYDSGAITELNDYTQEDNGESTGEAEGLHYRNGFVLVANTKDPSVALFKASWVD